MDWTTLLKTQQADFIQRLKSGCLLRCEIEGQHSELTVISGSRVDQLRNFCWGMAEKYKRTSPVRDVFINNLKGKLGEEVVKARLADLVTEIDYEKRLGGDGKIDFTLTSDSSIGIQVKARHGSTDKVRWSISSEEVDKNAVLVCILIQEAVNEAQAEYNLVLAGFLTKDLIKDSGEFSFQINDLLYGGGLQFYLKNLPSFKTEYLFIPIPQIKDNNQLTYEQYQDIFLGNLSRSYTFLSLGINHFKEEKYEEALKDFNEVICLNPNNASGYFWRAKSLFMLSQIEYPLNNQNVIDDINLALQLIPKIVAEYYDYRGFAYFWLDDIEAAIKDLTQAIRINSDNAEYYHERSNIYSFVEDFCSSVKDLTNAIKINPTNAEYYERRADAYFYIGDYDSSIIDYTEAIRINPNKAQCYHGRANVRINKGDKLGAIEDLKEAAELYKQQNMIESYQSFMDEIKQLQQELQQ